jgi:hypothetical protein
MGIPILTITGDDDGDQSGAMTYYRDFMRDASPAARQRHYLVIGPWDHAGTRTPVRQVGGLEFGEASMIDLNRLHKEWYDWTLKDGPRPEFLKPDRRDAAAEPLRQRCHLSQRAVSRGDRNLGLRQTQRLAGARRPRHRPAGQPLRDPPRRQERAAERRSAARPLPALAEPRGAGHPPAASSATISPTSPGSRAGSRKAAGCACSWPRSTAASSRRTTTAASRWQPSPAPTPGSRTSRSITTPTARARSRSRSCGIGPRLQQFVNMRVRHRRRSQAKCMTVAK